MDTVKYSLLECIRATNCEAALTEGKAYLTSPASYHHNENYEWCSVLDDMNERHDVLLNRFKERHESPEDVSKQDHYHRFDIEPLEFITRNKLAFWAGNVIKYVCRYDAKDGLRDLKKARDYLDKQIRYMEGDKEWCR